MGGGGGGQWVGDCSATGTALHTCSFLLAFLGTDICNNE